MFLKHQQFFFHYLHLTKTSINLVKPRGAFIFDIQISLCKQDPPGILAYSYSISALIQKSNSLQPAAYSLRWLFSLFFSFVISWKAFQCVFFPYSWSPLIFPIVNIDVFLHVLVKMIKIKGSYTDAITMTLYFRFLFLKPSSLQRLWDLQSFWFQTQTTS